MLLSSIFTSHETFQVKLLQTTILKSPVNTACFKQSKKAKLKSITDIIAGNADFTQSIERLSAVKEAKVY